MAAPTPTQVRTRIEAICATVPGITTVLDGTEDAITAAMLPAVRVVSRQGRRERTNRDKLLVTRTYQILLYVAYEGESMQPEQQPNLDAAEAWIDVIPDFFAAQRDRRLILNGDTLDGVWDTGEMTDNGPVLRQWRRGVFTGVSYQFEVTTQRA